MDGHMYWGFPDEDEEAEEQEPEDKNRQLEVQVLLSTAFAAAAQLHMRESWHGSLPTNFVAGLRWLH
jgi:hypothetical protein